MFRGDVILGLRLLLLLCRLFCARSAWSWRLICGAANMLLGIVGGCPRCGVRRPCHHCDAMRPRPGFKASGSALLGAADGTSLRERRLLHCMFPFTRTMLLCYCSSQVRRRGRRRLIQTRRPSCEKLRRELLLREPRRHRRAGCGGGERCVLGAGLRH